MTAAVLGYVEKRSVVADLLKVGIMSTGADGKLVTELVRGDVTPDLFKVLPAKKEEGKESKKDQGDAFVRWRVETPGVRLSGVWEDPGVRDSWSRYVGRRGELRGLCMVTGDETSLAENHPKRVRHAGDGAKLISSNDTGGFTFRGRFETAGQAYGIGALVTQKAHSALRWLISRQGSRVGDDQVFVSWCVAGKDLPDPLGDA